MADLPAKRHAYAGRGSRIAGVIDPRTEAAFAAVPREDFGRDPAMADRFRRLWLGLGQRPGRLDEDVLVGIDARRGINNGQPSLHAQALDALKANEGETSSRSARAPAIIPRSCDAGRTDGQGDRL